MLFNTRTLVSMLSFALVSVQFAGAHDFGHGHNERFYRPAHQVDAAHDLARRAGGPKVAVVTCMDPRIEVDWLLTQIKVSPETAYIVRNAGGRAKEAVRSIAASQQFLGTSEVHVIHHTLCGMAGQTEASMRQAFNSNNNPAVSSAAQKMEWLPIPTTNFTQSVQEDIALLKNQPLVKQGTKITGWVYNVSPTGQDSITQVY